MKIVNVAFRGYGRVYSFKTKLPLREKAAYKIRASGMEYSAPVRVVGYSDRAPIGIELKEIEEAEEISE